MAVSKCLNCGAEIPRTAEFCPSCGAPKGGTQAAAQPAQPMQPMQPAPMSMQKVSPLAGIFDMFFSKTGIILGVAIGILLAWIGVLILVFSTENSDIATLLDSMGFAAISLMLIGGGVWNKKIDKFARLGMVLIGGYAAAHALAILSAFTSIASQANKYVVN